MCADIEGTVAEGLAAAIGEAKHNGELPPRLDEDRFLLAISMMADGFFCRRGMDPAFDEATAADTLFASMRELAQTMLLPEARRAAMMSAPAGLLAFSSGFKAATGPHPMPVRMTVFRLVAPMALAAALLAIPLPLVAQTPAPAAAAAGPVRHRDAGADDGDRPERGRLGLDGRARRDPGGSRRSTGCRSSSFWPRRATGRARARCWPG